ncbi:MAG: hypothetical protein AB7S44_03390 [Spirochaetales bacterium]
MKNKIANIFIVLMAIFVLGGCELNFFNTTSTPESMVGIYKFESLLVNDEDQTDTMVGPDSTMYYYFGQDGTHFTVLSTSGSPYESRNITTYTYNEGSLTVDTTTYTVYEKNNILYLTTTFGSVDNLQDLVMTFSYVDATTSQAITDYFIN